MGVGGGIPLRGRGALCRPGAAAGEGLLLLSHGSRCHLGVSQVRYLAELVEGVAGELAVEVGFLEMSRPASWEAVDTLVQRGCTRVVVLPLVLLGAGHAKSDSPAVVWEARARHPQVQFVFGHPLGLARELVELLGGAIVAAGGSGLPLLVLARGSSDPDANSDAYKAARLVAEWARSPVVQVGFSGITRPSVREAAGILSRLGCTRVAVGWWFLCHGRLVERGRRELSEVLGDAGVEVLDAGYIGPEPALVPLVLRRYREALGGVGEAGETGEKGAPCCDRCSYRAPWPGLESRVGQPVGVGHSHLALAHRALGHAER